MKKLYVTYCCKGKSEKEIGTPKEIYTSQRIKTFFKKFPRPKGILSYKWGLIMQFHTFVNYDQDNFSNLEYCAKRLKFIADDREIIFYSPREIVEKPWIELLELSGVRYGVVRSYKDLKRNRIKKFLSSKT